MITNGSRTEPIDEGGRWTKYWRVVPPTEIDENCAVEGGRIRFGRPVLPVRPVMAEPVVTAGLDDDRRPANRRCFGCFNMSTTRVSAMAPISPPINTRPRLMSTTAKTALNATNTHRKTRVPLMRATVPIDCEGSVSDRWEPDDRRCAKLDTCEP
jgi:hypothetical protein